MKKAEAPAPKWCTWEGSPIACTEKNKVMAENLEEIKGYLQDAIDDAVLLVCCAALFLTACAHPDMIKLNDTYDHSVKELGVPDSTTRLPDGSIRIVYSMQPMGQTSYVMIFNPEGRLIFKDQLLQQKYFNQIKPKVQDSQDIYTMFGKPCEQWHYRNLGEHTYMYRYLDESGFPMALWVDFDDKDDKVLRYVLSIDPWVQRDADQRDF